MRYISNFFFLIFISFCSCKRENLILENRQDLIVPQSDTENGSKPGIGGAGYNPADRGWVTDANVNIDKYRKSEHRILVRHFGKPVEGAIVEIEQIRHLFSFGSAVTSKMINSNTPDGIKYREIVKANYNEVVLENDLKWSNWKNTGESEKTKEQIIKSLKWLRNNDIKVRGHCLAWAPVRNHSSFNEVISVDQLNDPLLFKAAILKHAKDILSRTKGLIAEWDAINHLVTTNQQNQLHTPLGEGILLNAYVGNDVYKEIFGLSNQISPEVRNYVNEGNILPKNAKQEKVEYYYDQILSLQKSGAKIDGVGFMGHFTLDNLPSMRSVESKFNKYLKLGIPIKITEFDVRYGNQGIHYQLNESQMQLQKQFTEDFLRICFSQPNLSGVVMWGFWEESHWYPSAALYNADWSIRSNGEAWKKLVLNEWCTKGTWVTGPNGVVDIKAFHGEYLIKVKDKEGKVISKTYLLDNTPNSIVLDI